MSATPISPRVCAYCQLPLPSGWWGRIADSAERDLAGVFCCLGCRIAAAIIQEKGETGAARGMLTRLGLSIFFTMNVMAFTMALWTTDVYEAANPANQLLLTLHGLFRYVVLLFSLPVLFLLGIPLVASTLESLRRGIISTDALLSLGVSAAFAASFVAVLLGHGPIYFEVGCVIVVMTFLGRWLEATGRLKATSALDALARLLPETVRKVGTASEPDTEKLVRLDEIAVGDVLRIAPGERFPTDGQVVRNASLVDEQVLTGESRPVLKERGSPILGGTLNLDGDLLVKVTAVGDHGTLARLVELVRLARLSKGRYQHLVDRISTWFFPAVASLAMLSFILHWAFGSFGQGLMAALAVSLIACPCALGLATPLAVWSALGQAASHQILFRSGEALERLADVQALRFDKTGTLSTGTAVVQSCQFEHPEDARNTLLRSAALAGSSRHALSAAIVEFQTARSGFPQGRVSDVRVSDVRVIPGRGAIGTLEASETSISLGSPLLMDERGLQFGPKLASALARTRQAGQSLAVAGWDGEVRGLFVFAERWRPDIEPVLGWLRESGIDLAVLTGDHADRGHSVAEELGVPVLAELLPDQKVAAIRQAHAVHGSVAMVGDGINDAPALAVSDVGIALGCGTDVSRDSASICLLGDDLTRIPWTIELARRTVRVIRQNLRWAFLYNSVGIIVAALGWLNPAFAAFLMVISSALVIGNSLRLRQPFSVHLPSGKPIESEKSSVDTESRAAEIPVAAGLPESQWTLEMI
jgi:heavy metal translocating P-type ATPase